MLRARPNVNRPSLVVASQLQPSGACSRTIREIYRRHTNRGRDDCLDDLTTGVGDGHCRLRMDGWFTASPNRSERDAGIEAHPRRLPPRVLEASPARGRELGRGRRLCLCAACKVTGAPPPTRSPRRPPRGARGVARPASRAQATPVASLAAARPTAVSTLPLIASARTSSAACNHARMRHRRSMPPSGFAGFAIRTLTLCTRRPKRLRASRTRRTTIARTACDTRTFAAITSIFKVPRVA
jgi:hypothetical protein